MRTIGGHRCRQSTNSIFGDWLIRLRSRIGLEAILGGLAGSTVWRTMWSSRPVRVKMIRPFVLNCGNAIPSGSGSPCFASRLVLATIWRSVSWRMPM